MCSAHFSLEEGDHNEEGKHLNFIQHDAGLLSMLYSSYAVGSATLQQSLQRHHCAGLFQVISRGSGERDHILALSSTRTAALLLQHVYT